jgi:hypothetical protein
MLTFARLASQVHASLLLSGAVHRLCQPPARISSVFVCTFSDIMFIQLEHMWLYALVCTQTPSLLRAVLRLATEPASLDEGSTPDGDAVASIAFHACRKASM